ncbi:hypothetical protein [Cognatishimia sp. MH4019]|uniref:hypothetical protein n=1 Tax=Cognatishimia sp. MH4019 TaxID=2854030 RepID=UPI001CD63133|nr:hypothetical protein [Cognatishimia sp. MH4019]
MPKSDFDDLVRKDERADLDAPRWSLFMLGFFCCLIGASSIATPWIVPFPASLILGVVLLALGITLVVKFYKAKRGL